MWLPYRSSLSFGDILRDPVNICRVALGQMVNFTALRYPYITGYTMQHYSNGNIVSPQTNAIVRTKVANKLTPAPLDYSNKPRGADGAMGVLNKPY